MLRLSALVLVIASLGLAACGDDDDEAAEEPPAVTEEPAGSQAQDADKADSKKAEDGGSGVEIASGDSQYGEVLFDGEEQAIYLFDKETSDRSECYGECAEAWPPVLTKGDPQAGGDVEEKLLGTTERDDGSTQVTYDGQPLYYYVDEPPGEVLCHNVEEFGGLWLALDPSGAAIQ